MRQWPCWRPVPISGVDANAFCVHNACIAEIGEESYRWYTNSTNPIGVEQLVIVILCDTLTVYTFIASSIDIGYIQSSLLLHHPSSQVGLVSSEFWIFLVYIFQPSFWILKTGKKHLCYPHSLSKVAGRPLLPATWVGHVPLPAPQAPRKTLWSAANGVHNLSIWMHLHTTFKILQ